MASHLIDGMYPNGFSRKQTDEIRAMAVRSSWHHVVKRALNVGESVECRQCVVHQADRSRVPRSCAVGMIPRSDKRCTHYMPLCRGVRGICSDALTQGLLSLGIDATGCLKVEAVHERVHAHSYDT